jgi:hypothetical protein
LLTAFRIVEAEDGAILFWSTTQRPVPACHPDLRSG